MDKAKPSAAHHFMKKVADNGQLFRIYTQNIDGLELNVGLNCGWDKPILSASEGTESTAKKTSAENQSVGHVIQLHGNMNGLVCVMCREKKIFDEEDVKLFAAGLAPDCINCKEKSEARVLSGKRALSVGFMRPDIVLYNENHPHGDVIGNVLANDIAKRPNLVIVMGTALKVVGLKHLLKKLAASVAITGGHVIYVNKVAATTAEWKGLFDYQFVGNADDWVSYFEENWDKRKCSPSPNQPAKIVDYFKISKGKAESSSPSHLTSTATRKSGKKNKKGKDEKVEMAELKKNGSRKVEESSRAEHEEITTSSQTTISQSLESRMPILFSKTSSLPSKKSNQTVGLKKGRSSSCVKREV